MTVSVKKGHAQAPFERLKWDALDPDHLRQWLTLARDEDLAGSGLIRPSAPPGDPTTASLTRLGSGEAELVAQQSLTVCGLPLMPLVLEVCGAGASFRPKVKDGDTVET